MRAFLTALLMLAALAPVAQARTDRLDRAFAGGKGFKTFLVGGRDSAAQSVLRTRHGKLLVGGYSGGGLGFARLHPSGRFDERFGRGGRAVVHKPEELVGVAGMAEVRNGRVLVGVRMNNHAEDVGAVGVLRLRPGGRPDRSYGANGLARVAVPGPNPLAVSLVAMLRLPGDEALLVGNTTDTLDERVFVAKLGRRGRLLAGPTIVDLAGHAVSSAARLPTGEIAVGATDYDAPRHSLIAVLREDGTVVRQVDAPGVSVGDVRRDGDEIVALVHRNFRWGVRRYTAELAVQPHPGELFHGAAGSLAVGRRHRAWVSLVDGRVARVRRDGTLDKRFGKGGRSTPITRDWIVDTTDLITHPRGGAVTVGRASQDFDVREDYGPARMFVARYF
jgi:hypothetical protein